MQRVIAAQLARHARVVVHGVPGTPVLPPEVPVTKPKGRQPKPEGVNADEPWRHAVPGAGPAPKVVLLSRARVHAGQRPDGPASLQSGAAAGGRRNRHQGGASANPASRPGLAWLHCGHARRRHRAPQRAADRRRTGPAGCPLQQPSSGAETSLVSLMSLKANFGKTLEIAADMVRNPAFPEAEVARQRAARLDDLSQHLEDASAMADEMASLALYGNGHPFACGSLGTEAAIKATTRADLHGFWQQHYVPNNTALVLSGDLTADEARALAEAYFGSWQPGQAGTRRTLLSHAGHGARGAGAKDRFVPDRAADHLARHRPQDARLRGPGSDERRAGRPVHEPHQHQSARRQRLQLRRVLDVRLPPHGLPVRDRRQRAHQRHRRLGQRDLQGSARCAEHPLSSEELHTAINAQVLSLPGHFDTNEGVGGSLASIFAYDLPLDYYSTLAAQYQAVTAEQVQAMAIKYLVPEKMVVVAVGDRKKIEPQLKKLKLGPIEVRDGDGRLH
ncbi:insulinase family protein [Massilia sp. B-10]|nr:insulinase family protein [Massilia sp. B-10]